MDERVGRAAVELKVQREPNIASHANSHYAPQPCGKGQSSFGADDEHELNGDAAGIVMVPLDVFEPAVECHARRKSALHEELPVDIPIEGEAERGELSAVAPVDAEFVTGPEVEGALVVAIAVLGTGSESQGRELDLRGHGFSCGGGAAEEVLLTKAGIRLFVGLEVFLQGLAQLSYARAQASATAPFDEGVIGFPLAVDALVSRHGGDGYRNAEIAVGVVENIDGDSGDSQEERVLDIEEQRDRPAGAHVALTEGIESAGE